MKVYEFTAQIEKDPDMGLYVGIVPNVPGAHTQAKTLDELNKNLKEVLELCIEEMSKKEIKNIPELVGFQQVRIAV
jgi:predicted RNase H-like HicB family nuclease